MTIEPDQKPTMLLIEDDPDGRRSVADALTEAGYKVVAAECGCRGVELFGSREFDAVLSDIKLPDIDGMAVLAAVRSSERDVPVILMTAYGTVAAAVAALKAGAYDYILKPLNLDDLQSKVGHAIEAGRLRSQVASLKQELFARPIVAKSEKMLAILKQVRMVAPTRANVLILGESGVGKELVAHALHALSVNPKGPFVAVNCGAFVESLLESELFGHEKGAFTGATQMRSGAFERAHGGSLFLDEVGLASAQVQSRLLRVLEEREIMRVGGEKNIPVDVRIISASNRNLEDLVAEKAFRHDLLYRLQVVTINIPPLRERPGDIRPLAEHFISRACETHGRHIESVAPDFYAVLERQQWPGNVRELNNVIESAVIMAKSPQLKATDIKLIPQAQNPACPDLNKSGNTLADVEKETILNALQFHKGSRTLAARQLGISTRTIQRKIKDYDLPF